MSLLDQDELTELKELARTNTYHVHGDPKSADCILAFSFGYIKQNEKNLPGKSNQQIATFIELNLPNIPLIAQFEVADALKATKPVLRITAHRIPGKYLDSGEVAAQAHEFMKLHRWDRAFIVTHPALEARNDYICTALGMETIAPSGLDSIEFDNNSEQEWTRDAQSWWAREQGIIDLCYQNDWLKKPRLS